jgi:DNA replicative helicase MCM subunit Mcm2 (Cdc46/Mcm family)
MNEEEEADEGKVMPPIRPDIHVLMVGEPGLGKS